MAGRTPVEAVDNFVGPLQRALACVAHCKVTLSRGGRNEMYDLHALTVNDGRPLALSGDQRLRLLVQMNYRIVEAEPPRGPFKIKTAAYNYAIERETARPSRRSTGIRLATVRSSRRICT